MDAAVEVFVANVASKVWRSTSVWLVGYDGPSRCCCSFPLAFLTDTLGCARNLLGRVSSGFCALAFDLQDGSLSDRQGWIGSSGARPLRMCRPPSIVTRIHLHGFPNVSCRLPFYCGSLELTALVCCSITQLFEQGPSGFQVADLKAQNSIALTNA